ncbi:sensor histidine kinase [Paenibacillus daejeonensis]|uniref:sensor histidine kinase n=1 Tax=Paenibacillus daejeonensis TaxID=135193 RepID=UPI00036A35FD|nr:sensor histidine kinase [Paenibacillus daejeonensis]
MGLKSIQFRLTLLFLTILMPLTAVGLYVNAQAETALESQARQQTASALASSMTYIDLIMENLDEASLLLSTNENVIQAMDSASVSISPESLFDLRTVQQDLNTMSRVSSKLDEAIVLHGSSGYVLSSDRGFYRTDGYQQEMWYRMEHSRRQGSSYVYLPNSTSLGITDGTGMFERERLYMIRRVDFLNQTSRSDFVLVSINKRRLQDIVAPLLSSEQASIALRYNGQTAVELGEVVADTKLFQVEVTGKMGWTLQYDLPEAEVLRSIQHNRTYTYLIIVLSILLAVLISWIIYNRIAKPLTSLTRAMNQFSLGNLKTRIPHRRSDEFGYVMDSFNQMAEKQRVLVEEDYEKQLRLAKAEFRLLQSQINPHFLYNTLDSVYSVALEHEEREISDMVYNLALFFRVSLGKGKDRFTVEETMAHLMYYLRVQQLRLMDRFEVQIEMAEETRSIPVLKLLLQPIVENAVIHGLEKRQAGGELRIASSIVDGMLLIQVQDTGLGMPVEVCQELQSRLAAITVDQMRLLLQEREESIPPTRFFGLTNVQSRLKLYYGEAAGLELENHPQRGLTVNVWIPLEEEGEMEHESVGR